MAGQKTTLQMRFAAWRETHSGLQRAWLLLGAVSTLSTGWQIGVIVVSGAAGILAVLRGLGWLAILVAVVVWAAFELALTFRAARRPPPARPMAAPAEPLPPPLEPGGFERVEVTRGNESGSTTKRTETRVSLDAIVTPEPLQLRVAVPDVSVETKSDDPQFEFAILDPEWIADAYFQFSGRVRNVGDTANCEARVGIVANASTPDYGEFNLAWERTNERFQRITGSTAETVQIGRFYPAASSASRQPAFRFLTAKDGELQVGTEQWFGRDVVLGFDLHVLDDDGARREFWPLEAISTPPGEPGQPTPYPVLRKRDGFAAAPPTKPPASRNAVSTNDDATTAERIVAARDVSNLPPVESGVTGEAATTNELLADELRQQLSMAQLLKGGTGLARFLSPGTPSTTLEHVENLESSVALTLKNHPRMLRRFRAAPPGSSLAVLKTFDDGLNARLTYRITVLRGLIHELTEEAGS